MLINSRVVVVREAITKIIPILGEKKVTVTQRGSRAYVEWDKKTLLPKRVNIPYIPDDASDEILDATQGFLDHELGHILFTDSKVVKRAYEEKVSFLHNVIEDTFIERKMSEKFPGSGHNLSNVRKFFLNGVIVRDLAAHPEQAINILIVPVFRAWAGQHVFIDYMKDKWPLVKDLTDRMGADVPARVAALSSSEDGLTLALDIKKRLMQDMPESQDNQFGEGESGEGEEGEATDSEDAGGGDDTMSKKEKDDKKDKPQKGKGKKEKKKEKEKKDDKDPSSTESKKEKKEGTPEAGEPKEDDKGEEDKKGDKGEKGEKSDDATKDDSEGSGGEPDDEEKESDAASGGEDDSPPTDKDDESADDGSPASGDGDKGDKGDSDSEDPSGETASGTPGDDADTGDTPEKAGKTPSFYEDLEKVGIKDFDDAVAEKLTETTLKANEDSDYLIFTREEDVIAVLDPIKQGYTDDHLRTLQDDVDHMLGPLQKDMERAMAAKSAALWTGGHRSGRLQGSALHRIMVRGDDDVFRRKQINRTKDVAVELVFDCSGSMRGGKMRLAARAGYGLCAVLDRMNIHHEAIGFTTKSHSREMLDYIAQEYREYKRDYSRLEALYMPIIKGFGERLNPEVRKRFAVLSHVNFCNQNVDGECVQIAGQRLLQQRQTRKVMLVLSDGHPACPGNSNAQETHLKAVVKDLMKKGIDVVGLGIQDRAVLEFYPKCVILNKLEDLPKEVMGQIKHLLLQ